MKTVMETIGMNIMHSPVMDTVFHSCDALDYATQLSVEVSADLCFE